MVVRLDSSDIGRLFDILDLIPDDELQALLTTVARMPADDAVRAATLLSGMTPTAISRLVTLAGQPGVTKLVGFTLGRGGNPGHS